MDVKKKYQIIDNIYTQYANKIQEDNWLLVQSVLNGRTRRGWVEQLPIQKNDKILDVGCGFGAVALDLIANYDVDMHVLDHDKQKLIVLNDIVHTLMDQIAFPRWIQSTHADLYNTPFQNEEFNWTVLQYVMQHLSNPEKALAEMYRITAPGGKICLVDTDDGGSLRHPPSPAYQELFELFTKQQQQEGGDRFMGRKLAQYVTEAGFSVVNIIPSFQAHFASIEQRKLSLVFLRERFEKMNDPSVPRLLEKWIEEEQNFVFESALSFAVIAQKMN